MILEPKPYLYSFDIGRGRKTSQEEKTRSERYPKGINLKEIKPKSENSEEDLKERYLNEIDPRKRFRGVLRRKVEKIPDKELKNM
jgi:hypothetical protein